jgi:hypothetical protein
MYLDALLYLSFVGLDFGGIMTTTAADRPQVVTGAATAIALAMLAVALTAGAGYGHPAGAGEVVSSSGRDGQLQGGVHAVFSRLQARGQARPLMTAAPRQGHGGAAGDSDGHDGHGGPNGQSVAWEPGQDGRGGAVVFRGEASEFERDGRREHHHDELAPCRPTAEQQAAADGVYRETVAALRKYENNPALALADGFYFAVGPNDRYVHMVAPERVADPMILVGERIESFMYAQTDRGLVPIGGMYVMPAEFTERGLRPAEPSAGPEFGGCLTRWHDHGGEGLGALTGGTIERTPEMLHVWTYPGLEPYGHYDGRDLAALSTPGSYLPMLCRETEDHSACTP